MNGLYPAPCRMAAGSGRPCVSIPKRSTTAAGNSTYHPIGFSPPSKSAETSISETDILYQIHANQHHIRYTVSKRSLAMVRILLSARLGERRLTQADLSRMTGIRKNTISDLYNEIATRISLDHLDLICEALDCDLTDLIVRTPNKERRVKNRTGTSMSGQSE